MARGARRLHPGDGGVDLAPVALAGLLEMIDFRRSARLRGNLDQLVDRLEQLGAFVAHVTDVHAAALGGFGG